MSAPLTPPRPLPPTPTLRQVLAHNVRALRVQQGLSQEALALSCNLDRTYVSAVERCAWNISLGNIEKLATRLGVPPWRLLCSGNSGEILRMAFDEPLGEVRS